MRFTTSSARAWPPPTPVRPRRPRRRRRARPGRHLLLPVPRRRLHQRHRPHPHPARAGSPDRFGLGVVNCQWFETGTYAAYRHLARRGPRPRRCTSATTSTSTPARHRGRPRSRARPRARSPWPTTGSATPPTSSTRTCRPPTHAASRSSSPGTTTRWPTTTWATRPGGRRPGEQVREPQGRRLPGLVGAPPRAARPARRLPSWRSTRPSTSATWPASTCSTSASTATSPPCRDEASARRLRRLRRADRRGPDPARRRPGGVVRRGVGQGEHRDVEPHRQPGRAGRASTAATSRRPALLPRHLGRLPRRPAPPHRRRWPRSRQPRRAHRRLPRRHGARRARAPLRPGGLARGPRVHGAADLVALFDADVSAAPRSCASRSTSTAT